MSKARLVITAVITEGRSQGEVARAYGVSQGWVSRLVARYRAEGKAAFEPRSRRPKSSPRTIPDATVGLIVKLRKDLAGQGLDAGPHTIACPFPGQARARLRGGRAGTAQPPRLPDPLTVTRRVPVRGAIMIGGQKIQAGLVHARKTAQVTMESDTYQITVDPGITITAPRTTSRDIKRHKASNYQPG